MNTTYHKNKFDYDDFEQVKFSIETVLYEYQHRCDEMKFYMEQYHKHTNFLQVYLTIIGSLIFILIKETQIISKLGNSLVINSFLITFASLIILYFISIMLESLYFIYINGCRIANIEQIINKKLNENILIWDSEIIHKIQNLYNKPNGMWVRPTYIQECFGILIILSIICGLSILAYKIANPFFYWFVPIILFLTFIIIWQWYLLTFDGINYINSVIENKVFIYDKNQIIVLFFITNFCIGYLPMVLLSIRDNSFFSNQYQFGFMSLSSVWFGGLFILPLIYYYIYLYCKVIKFPKLFIIPIIGTSIVLNYKFHHIWISDNYFRFMGMISNELTTVGIVYTANSIVCMSFVFAFFVAVLYKKELAYKKIKLRQLSKKILWWLILFLVLGLVDDTYKFFYLNMDFSLLFVSVLMKSLGLCFIYLIFKSMKQKT